MAKPANTETLLFVLSRSLVRSIGEMPSPPPIRIIFLLAILVSNPFPKLPNISNFCPRDSCDNMLEPLPRFRINKDKLWVRGL